jgi:hypothetical protein
LLVSILAHDIDRPFYGLHSWAQASGAWAARSHVKYGFGYTKGISTWALGQHPKENPQRYWDHPQLNCVLASIFMRIFGINEWALRVSGICLSVIVLILFLRILRGLTDDSTSLLSGLILVLLPITGYFSFGGWQTLMGFSAIWFYLVTIGAFTDSSVKATKWHRIGLTVSLFFAIQFGWGGFFFAFGIGLHYVSKCVFQKQCPEWSLFAILVLAPLLSLLLNFTVMAGGYDWDVNKITELFKWRSSKGEMQQMKGFDWGAWNTKFWEFAQTNFTLPVLILAIGYLTLGQLFVFMARWINSSATGTERLFPQFWLFFSIPMAQLFILKGCLWKHQSWERPFGPFLAISSALAIFLVGDVISKINRKFGQLAMIIIIAIVLIFCVKGTDYYYSIRWQPQAKIDMFKKLNRQIPPDKALLSFEDFIVNQHKSKGGFVRPEIAWYLDRNIDTARDFEEIQEKAKTGNYPYYLMPLSHYDQQATAYLNNLGCQLRNIYKYEYVPAVNGKRTNDGKFLSAGMQSYMIIDLNIKM